MDNYILQPRFSPEELDENSKGDSFILRNVFDNEAVKSLAKEVSSLPFVYSNNDLHCMGQTRDFSELQLPPLCRQFHQLMDKTFKTFIEETFSIGKISDITMTASIYKENDYLLCHDDRVGDRAVAFIFYLTENWTKKNGGRLKFFSFDKDLREPIIEKYKNMLTPEFNSMVLFRVSESSFHEVEEVFGKKARLSINGWFHAKQELNKTNKTTSCNQFLKAPLFTFTKSCVVSSKDILSPEYRSPVTCEDLAGELCNTPRVFARNFLMSSFYQEVKSELIHNQNWIIKGPPFRRKYETLEIRNGDSGISIPENNLEKLSALLNFLISPFWLTYLCKITGLELAVLQEDHVPPTCMVEVQRWRAGCYSALASNDILQEQPTVEISLFFDVNEDYTHPIDQFSVSSGSIVHIVKQRQAMGPEFYKNLLTKRIRHKIADYARSQNNNKIKPSPLQLISGMKRIQELVKEKVKRIQSYRESRTTEQTEYITPENNTFLLTMNSKNTNKYTSYLKKTHLEDDSIRYYCVTVTYFTAAGFDDNEDDCDL